MSDGQMKYHVRFYAKNPGGAYDPAHLPQFEIESQDHPPTIAPGDVVFSWLRTSRDDKGSNEYFRVIERHFRFDQSEVFVFVLVEQIEDQWPSNFG